MRQREVRLRRDKTRDAMDQASWRSSFLDDPGTKFICGKQGRSTKKETSSKKPGGLWKLTPRWKSAKNADFHRGLKSLANDARLFHSSHRPNNHHQLKTLTRRPEVTYCSRKLAVRELIHQEGGAKSKDQKGPNQVDRTSSTWNILKVTRADSRIHPPPSPSAPSQVLGHHPPMHHRKP